MLQKAATSASENTVLIIIRFSFVCLVTSTVVIIVNTVVVVLVQ